MGSKKKAKRVQVSRSQMRKEKPKSESSLMSDVEKSNPEFVKWLRSRKGGKGSEK